MTHETSVQKERALLVAVDLGKYDADSSLEELALLAETAEIDVIGYITQKRDSLDRATCIGSGKVDEISEFSKANDIDLIIFDHELTATQLRNLEESTDIAVIDRTMLILDIFSAHANTSEGRLQVDLAQHKYLLPRLSGMGKSLSRLGGGGSGSAGARRGKGESKLELDRRHIRKHINQLEDELEEVSRRRTLLRERRKKDSVTTVALIGYTNVGKSSLLNALTDAGVLAENKLFATLDPTSRALTLPDGRIIMLIDTVGLIQRLPHHLVNAFKSTLEEAVYADLILNVCDISNVDFKTQIDVTTELLKDIGAESTTVLTVVNKIDLVHDSVVPESGLSVGISAKTGYGLDKLLIKISEVLEPSQKEMNLLIPYSLGSIIGEIRLEGKVLSEEFVPEGISLHALVDNKILHKVEQYVI